MARPITPQEVGHGPGDPVHPHRSTASELAGEDLAVEPQHGPVRERPSITQERAGGVHVEPPRHPGVALDLTAPTPHPTMVLQVGHSGAITALAYSPDGQTLATGSDDGRAALGYSERAGQGEPASGVCIRPPSAPDGKTLATDGDDGRCGSGTWPAASSRRP